MSMQRAKTSMLVLILAAAALTASIWDALLAGRDQNPLMLAGLAGVSVVAVAVLVSALRGRKRQ
jgi:hypothetical protein